MMIDKQALIDSYPKLRIRDEVSDHTYSYKAPIGRRKIAEIYLAETPTDYRSAFLLFDAIEDKEDFKWLKLMGRVLGDTESPFYNPISANALLHNAKILETINSQRAAKWQENLEEYFQEHSLGTAPIIAEERRSKFESLIYQFPPRFDHAYELFNPYVDNEDEEWIELLKATNSDIKYERLDEIADKVLENKKRFQFSSYRNDGFLNLNAQFYVSEKGYESRNYRVAFAYASLMSDKDYKKSSEIKGLVFCIISHAILFNKFDDLYDQAMLKFQQDEKSRVFCPCSDCSEALESLERILPQINTSMFKKAQKIVLEAYRKNCNFSLADEEGDNSVDLDMLLKESYEDGVPALVKDILLLQRLTAFKFVHSSVHGTDDFWESFIHQWEAVMQNLNVNDVVEETINYGPSYNQLSKNGLPIAGAYSGYFRGGPYDGTMIADGAGILESVRGTKEGKIKFKFSEASYALVLPEDIDVLTILSFCYEKHIFPSIDVPVALNLNTRFLREKRLEPQWLINTELGRTLYTTDVWAGEMAWGIDGFEMSSSQPSSLEAFQKIKKSLVGLGGLHVDLYPVINVNPKDFKRTKAAPFVGDEISIQVNAVKVGIDGGYTGKGRGWKHRNSKLYNHTRKTALLTESFNDIAVAFPVYERLRQLMATSYALRSLRKSGFMICPEDMDQLQERKKEFEMRFEVNPSPKYCTYLPISLTPKGFK